MSAPSIESWTLDSHDLGRVHWRGTDDVSQVTGFVVARDGVATRAIPSGVAEQLADQVAQWLSHQRGRDTAPALHMSPADFDAMAGAYDLTVEQYQVAS